jgi:hypothetical protein
MFLDMTSREKRTRRWVEAAVKRQYREGSRVKPGQSLLRPRVTQHQTPGPKGKTPSKPPSSKLNTAASLKRDRKASQTENRSRIKKALAPLAIEDRAKKVRDAGIAKEQEKPRKLQLHCPS